LGAANATARSKSRYRLLIFLLLLFFGMHLFNF